MTNDLKKILEYNLPSELKVNEQSGTLIIRDATVERGRGYVICINMEFGHIEVRFEFETFAGILAAYSAQQINEQREILEQLLAKYSQMSMQIVRQSTEDVLAPNSIKEDIWWLTVYCKLIKNEQNEYLIFSDILISLIFLLFPYEMEGSIEGKTIEEISKYHERSKANRALCLAFHGYDCKACGTNMRRFYSGLNNEFIHVHHLNPVAETGVIKPDPIKDMIPLCPNCHSVAHLRKPPYQLSELKSMIQEKL